MWANEEGVKGEVEADAIEGNEGNTEDSLQI